MRHNIMCPTSGGILFNLWVCAIVLCNVNGTDVQVFLNVTLFRPLITHVIRCRDDHHHGVALKVLRLHQWFVWLCNNNSTYAQRE